MTLAWIVLGLVFWAVISAVYAPPGEPAYRCMRCNIVLYRGKILHTVTCKKCHLRQTPVEW